MFHRVCSLRAFMFLVSGAVVLAGFQMRAIASDKKPARPLIKKLGTIDCDLVEATPLVFRDRLYRFEYVRDRYKGNQTGKSYFRFIDVASGTATASFAKGHNLGCALADGDKVFVYGVKGWGTPTIYGLWSDDLKKWSSRPVLDLPGWKIYNTSVCKADGRYIMAFEVGAPPEVIGHGFTNRFAESKDLIHWKLLPESHVYTKQRYSACPAIKFLNGQFYVIYLEARPGPTYESCIVRSKDLIHWETSPLNPVLRYSPEDKRIANPRLTAAERQRIDKAVNLNNSDIDLCEFKGKVVIYYSWGNQHGVEHLAEAVYEGTLAQFLTGFFPDRD